MSQFGLYQSMLLLILFSLFSSGTAARAENKEFNKFPLPPGNNVFNGQRPTHPSSTLKQVIQDCTGPNGPLCAVTTPTGRKLTKTEKITIKEEEGKVFKYVPLKGLKGGYSVVGPDNAGDKPKVNKGDKKGDKPKKPTNINKKK